MDDLLKVIANLEMDKTHLESYENADYNMLHDNSYIGQNLIAENMKSKLQAIENNSGKDKNTSDKYYPKPIN